jgi:hypothetical protein
MARWMLKSRTSERYRIRPETIAADSFRLDAYASPRHPQEAAMPKKPKSERIVDRPTEDDIAQAELGGPRGAAELPPVKLKRKTGTPPESDGDPGHTA